MAEHQGAALDDEVARERARGGIVGPEEQSTLPRLDQSVGRSRTRTQAGAALRDRPEQHQGAGAGAGRIGGGEDRAIADGRRAGGAEPAGAEAAGRTVDQVEGGVRADAQGLRRGDHCAELRGEGVDGRRGRRREGVVVGDEGRAVEAIGGGRHRVRGIKPRRIGHAQGAPGVGSGIEQAIAATSRTVVDLIDDGMKAGGQRDGYRSYFREGMAGQRIGVDRIAVDIQGEAVVRARTEGIGAGSGDLEETGERRQTGNKAAGSRSGAIREITVTQSGDLR